MSERQLQYADGEWSRTVETIPDADSARPLLRVTKPTPKGMKRIAIDVRLHATVPDHYANLAGADRLVQRAMASGWTSALRPEVRAVQRDE